MSWDKYEEAAEKGPWSLFWKVFLPLVAMVVVIVVVVGAISYTFGWIGEGAEVAQDEFGPRAALWKYETFIDEQNNIEKMNNDILTFEQSVRSVDSQYSVYGPDPSAWTPAIQVQYNHDRSTALDDLTSVVTLRNRLVSEYNAQSEKFNWTPFKTAPDLPPENYEEYVIPTEIEFPIAQTTSAP